MSDFGAILYLSKKERVAFEDAEIDEIKISSAKLRLELDLKNSMGNPYLFEVGKSTNVSDGKCYAVNILLSNYWGDAQDFKWHEKVEVKDLNVIKEQLAALLSTEYTINASFEWW